MTWKLATSPAFDKDFEKLPANIQKKLERQLRTLAVHQLTHPGLGIKKMVNQPGIWEGRIDRQYRFTFQFGNGILFLRRVGSHAIYKKP